MPNYNPDWPRDDRDMLVSDLFTGRWTTASRLAHRDSGARRMDCPTCAGVGIVAAGPNEGRARSADLTIGDLLAFRWSLRARRWHRVAEAAWRDCLDCYGTGAVRADQTGQPDLPKHRVDPNRR